jgi:hypothetical protein
VGDFRGPIQHSCFETKSRRRPASPRGFLPATEGSSGDACDAVSGPPEPVILPAKRFDRGAGTFRMPHFDFIALDAEAINVVDFLLVRI